MIVAAWACASAPARAPAPPASRASARAVAAPASGVLARRLRGRWEIIRYQSVRPIPPEAMPLMGELFDVLRVTFDGGVATFVAGGARETRPYSLREQTASGFQLAVPGGMFDGATFRAVDDDLWEVVDEGERWPGKSTLQRTQR